MREIKFRGYNGDKWVYGDLIHDSCNGHELIFIDDNVERTRHSVDKDTVGQFTGLHDSDRREIYEGDVLGASKTTVLVEWGVDGWVADCFTLLEWLKLHESHVIGNIYDNPELLEAKNARD